MPEIISPYTITYKGKLADNQLIDSQDLAYSILGASKISTSIIHSFCLGKVPKGNYAKSYQCVSQPPQSGSYELIQCIIPIIPAAAENPQIFMFGVEFLFRASWSLILNRLIKGPNPNIESILEKVIESNQKKDETLLEAIKILTKGHEVRDENLIRLLSECLNNTIPEMAKANRTSAINFVQPVGKSCNTINNYFHNGGDVTIGIPEAEAIRSEEPDVVGEETEYMCLRITELNLSSGHCMLDISGFDEKVTGYIYDPVLSQPSNIYSTALDEHKSLRLTAKPILRAGELVKLCISNAHLL